MEENVWGDSFSPTTNSGIDSNGTNTHDSILTSTFNINDENISNNAIHQHLDKLVSSNKNQSQRQSAYLDDINENIDKKLAGIHLYNDYYHGDKESPLDVNLPLENNVDNQNSDSYSFKDFDRFDFNNLQKYQYLEYSDYDIPQILNYLINLPKIHPHLTTYPAALLFQCARYSDHMKQSKSDTESLLFLAFTKITSSISTTNNLDTATESTTKDTNNNHFHTTSSKKSDTLSNNETDLRTVKKTIDIVTQSYWISSLTYLYYFLTKDESFFKRHPSLLQELINTLHTIMIELVTSIHERLTPVIQKTLLNYTTIEEVKETLYKKDWNFFKKIRQAKLAKKREQARNLQRQNKLELRKTVSNSSNATTITTHNEADATEEETGSDEAENGIVNQNSLDENTNKRTHTSIFDPEILKHLYPPSLEEQMKPSPLKIVQIFGALTYVLNLHQVHPLFQQQCLSMAINWFSSAIFNQILKDKKKNVLSRARAVQIRLNLSTLESWIRNNDISVSKPKLIDDFIWERFPFTLIQDLGDIDLNNPTLHSITTFRPVKEDSGKTITDDTNSLFYYQTFHQIAFLHLGPVFELLQWLQIATSIDSEESLENAISLLPHLTPSQLLKAIDKYSYEVNEHKFNSKLRKHLSKLAKLSTIQQTYLEEKQIPLLCLPTVTELTDSFANDAELQPFLPDDIQDTIYEIHDANYKIRINYIGNEEEKEESDSNSLQNSQNDNDINDVNPFAIKDDRKGKVTNDDIFSSPTNAINTNNDTIFSNFTAPTISVAGPSWTFNSIAANSDNYNENMNPNATNDDNYDFETNPW